VQYPVIKPSQRLKKQETDPHTAANHSRRWNGDLTTNWHGNRTKTETIRGRERTNLKQERRKKNRKSRGKNLLRIHLFICLRFVKCVYCSKFDLATGKVKASFKSLSLSISVCLCLLNSSVLRPNPWKLISDLKKGEKSECGGLFPVERRALFQGFGAGNLLAHRRRQPAPAKQ
jgi:hypothetical protein